MKYLLLFVPIALLACAEHTPPGHARGKKAPLHQEVHITHSTRPVTVSLYGYINYLYDSTLVSPVAATPISISVNPGERVHRGHLLLTYWSRYQGYDYTPLEIRAPFSGVVSSIYAQINQPVQAGEELIRLLENQYLKMNIPVNPVLKDFFRNDQPATVQIDEHTLDGFVRFYKRRSQSLELFFNNPHLIKPPIGLIKTDIFLGEQKGTFIPSALFSSTDSLQAYIPELGPVEIVALGRSDSLSWIYPNLAGIDTLVISPDAEPPATVD